MAFRGTLALQSSIAALLLALVKGFIEWLLAACMLKIYCQVQKSVVLTLGSKTVNFCLNDVNFLLVRQGKQGNNKKKSQGCTSKEEGGASVMFFAPAVGPVLKMNIFY